MFDPTQPSTDSALSSAVMRSQLNSLKALIDAMVTLTGAQVDAVTTLPAGSPATAQVTVTGNTLHFTFSLPQGDIGPAGPPGPAGEVSVGMLESALTTTAQNPNNVSNISLDALPYYEQAQLQQVSDKLDELLNALRRV